MENLADPGDVIPVVLEVGGQRNRVRYVWPPVLIVVVNARTRWSASCQQSCAGRVAQRRGTVRVGKQNTALRQRIDVRRLNPRIAAKAANPVIHVIDGDEPYLAQTVQACHT